jgi:hypothetical protein
VPVVQWSARSHARGHQTSWPLQNKAVTSFHIKTQCQKKQKCFFSASAMSTLESWT